jgi:hypothetical protein
MISSHRSVSFEALISMVHHAQESLSVLETLESMAPASKCPSPVSLLVTHVICDLYDSHSSDEANINRITTNLEAVANDLLLMSKLFRNLGN